MEFRVEGDTGGHDAVPPLEEEELLLGHLISDLGFRFEGLGFVVEGVWVKVWG